MLDWGSPLPGIVSLHFPDLLPDRFGNLSWQRGETAERYRANVYEMIGSVIGGLTYTVSFDVQTDLGGENVAVADWYDVRLYAGGSQVASKLGSVTHDALFHNISFTYEGAGLAGGKDLQVEFRDVWAAGNSRTAGVIDNVKVSSGALAVPDSTTNDVALEPITNDAVTVPTINDVIPEPTSNALIGLGGLTLILR